MKFREMKYRRPDKEALKRDMRSVTERFCNAATAEEARDAFVAYDTLGKHISTQATLASIRHSIDTRDTFYDGEETFWNETAPELAEYDNAFAKALLKSPFREELAKEFGDIVLINAEMAEKAFSSEIIPDLQEENRLVQEYEKLLAGAQVSFEGKTCTLEQMIPYKTDADDARRLAAWKAEGAWFNENGEQFDALYDRLVHLRDRIGKKLGFDGYIPLAYLRMKRNCYTKEDVERFRRAVVDYLVPVADGIYRRQAERIGKTYPMGYSDNVLSFRSGNPRPKGTPDDLVQAGKRFYEALSPETAAFFNMMIDNGLMDLLATEGKRTGGYMVHLPEYEVPFIFANFNGTEHDVNVITHEAGHAFAGYINRKRVPDSTVMPTMEACEVHSMSMEFFAEEAAADFFGDNARKFLYSHLTGALKFIPYGTMVDHFQHIVFERPGLTPAERHAEWKRLQGIYMPWVRLDGEIPFYAEGKAWQRQHHIYSLPFYYIDYCLAQTVALSFWAQIQENREKAWERYMAYTKQGGSSTFTDMLEKAGLQTPFGGDMLEQVCERAKAYLDAFDLTGIE